MRALSFLRKESFCVKFQLSLHKQRPSKTGHRDGWWMPRWALKLSGRAEWGRANILISQQTLQNKRGVFKDLQTFGGPSCSKTL